MAEIGQVKGVLIGAVVPYDEKTKVYGKAHKLWLEADEDTAHGFGFSLPEEITRMIARKLKDEREKKGAPEQES